MEFFGRNTFKVDVIAREHANLDSFPFRFGMHHHQNWSIVLFNCQDFEWQIHPKKFLVTASFSGNDGRAESGRFVIWDNGHTNPKVGTVWREDKDSEFLLSQYLRSAREDGRLSVNDLLELHPLYLNGEANTLDKLARILYERESLPTRRAELEKTRMQAISEAEKQYEKLRSEAQAEEARLKRIAQMAVDGLKKAETTIVAQSGKIDNLAEDNQRLRDQIKEISKQSPQYDGSEVEISTVARLIGVERKQRSKSNGQLVNCVFLRFEGNSPERKMDEVFDPQNLVFNKAKNLVGEMVVTTTWKPEIFRTTHWFRDIFPWGNSSHDERQSEPTKTNQNSNQRIYLNCTYAEKDECKSLGGKWDPDVKKWYVTEASNINDFKKWLPQELNHDNTINQEDDIPF
jgi:hypothetical protein